MLSLASLHYGRPKAVKWLVPCSAGALCGLGGPSKRKKQPFLCFFSHLRQKGSLNELGQEWAHKTCGYASVFTDLLLWPGHNTLMKSVILTVIIDLVSLKTLTIWCH